MAFTVKKRLDLSYLGDGWANGTYLAFNAMTFAETREFSKLNVNDEKPDTEKSVDMVLMMLKSHYVEGYGFDGKSVVPITADDIENLPTDVITKAMELLAGKVDPK